MQYILKSLIIHELKIEDCSVNVYILYKVKVHVQQQPYLQVLKFQKVSWASGFAMVKFIEFILNFFLNLFKLFIEIY